MTYPRSNIVSVDEVEKPIDWPQNNREAKLETIKNCIDDFIKEPNYKNKEVLVSLVDINNLNEVNEFGLMRVTDYEVALINEIYIEATIINLDIIKVYLYGLIERTGRMYRICQLMKLDGHVQVSDEYIPAYGYLLLQLKLFYYSYIDFHTSKEGNYSDYLIRYTKYFIANHLLALEEIENAYLNLIKDLSYFSNAKVYSLFKFEKSELLKFFELEAYFVKENETNINERPLRGVLSLAIKNWILKSRNNYHEGSVYKNISTESANKALSNHEIWMQKIEFLNDKRERKAFRSLYNNKKWIKYNWAKNVVFDDEPNSFVCSYSKVPPTEKMKKRYGGNCFGYKSDRIAISLAPILMRNSVPQIQNVNVFDIIYSEEEIKEEINFLCEIIDLFDCSDDEKNKFLNHILYYWYLSFKDKKWETEQERRYDLRIFYDKQDYVDLDIDEKFLKTKSSVYLFHDFILTNNEALKNKVLLRRQEKLKSISAKDYLFCNNYLQSDYDLAIDERNGLICPICKSNNTRIIKIKP